MRSSHQRVLPFALVTLGFTWALQLPAVLAKHAVLEGGVGRWMGLGALGAFGPLLAAILFSYREAKVEGVRQLFRSMRIWRVGAHWYVIAFGIFGFAAVVATALYRALSGNTDVEWLYLPENAQHLSAMVLIPLVEEPGWRGFALPRLQARYGRLPASLVLGVIWAAWHVMMWIVQGLTPTTFALAFVLILGGSVVFSWIYNRTRGSLLIAVWAHVGVHFDNPFRAPPDQIAPLAIYTVAIVVLAVSLVLLDRDAWKPEPAP